jgi:hypothetical protein
MKEEWRKTDRCNLQFDLEQQIMAMWGTKEELELFLDYYMDGPKSMTEDEVHNLVYGIACMHNLKSDKAFSTFEEPPQGHQKGEGWPGYKQAQRSP